MLWIDEGGRTKLARDGGGGVKYFRMQDEWLREYSEIEVKNDDGTARNTGSGPVLLLNPVPSL